MQARAPYSSWLLEQLGARLHFPLEAPRRVLQSHPAGMSAEKLKGLGSSSGASRLETDPELVKETRSIPLQVPFPADKSYGQPGKASSAELGSPGKTVAAQGFGLVAELGMLSLEQRTQLAEDAARKRRPRIGDDEAARFARWREDYGKHLIETTLRFESGGVRLADEALQPLDGWDRGQLSLGLFVRDHPGGARVVKLLPQTGFHAFLVGNLLAEAAGGPKIHRFGRLDVSGGEGRLSNYRTVMFIEMEQLHPTGALGTLKQLVHEAKSREPRLPLAVMATELARQIVAALAANVVTPDPDLLFDTHGRARWLDGDEFTRVFDPEEALSQLRPAFAESAWLGAKGFIDLVREALPGAIKGSSLDPRRRALIEEAVAVF